MKSHIVEDGESRLCGTAEHQALVRDLRERILAKHAADLAGAGFFRRLVLRRRIAVEFRRELENMGPSKRSLFARH